MKFKQIIIIALLALMSLSVPCFSSDKQNSEISEIVDLNKNDTHEIECSEIIDLFDSQFIKCEHEKPETKPTSTFLGKKLIIIMLFGCLLLLTTYVFFARNHFANLRPTNSPIFLGLAVIMFLDFIFLFIL